jgi:hypothetical protein
LQTIVCPTQAPLAQWSPPVQAFPSVHVFVLSFVNTQPMAGAQESSVQLLPSSQTSAGPPVQVLPAQTSLVVHLLPSSQG